MRRRRDFWLEMPIGCNGELDKQWESAVSRLARVLGRLEKRRSPLVVFLRAAEATACNNRGGSDCSIVTFQRIQEHEVT